MMKSFNYLTACTNHVYIVVYDEIFIHTYFLFMLFILMRV